MLSKSTLKGLLTFYVLLIAATSNASDFFTIHEVYGRGDYPASVSTADFNSDGIPDIAAGGYDGNSVAIFLANGDGSFQPKVDYAVGSTPYCTANAYAVATGDFNGDGHVDLATSGFCNSVSVLLGRGDGTFQFNGIYWTWEYISSWAITTGDFNGDRKIDIATGGVIRLGNGDGTFQGPLFFSAGNEPYSLVSGDFNGDGKLDLATAGYWTAPVTVLLGNGDGTMQEPLFYSAGPAPYAITSGDFNGDGHVDLATANRYNSVSVLLGSGDGTFQPYVNYDAGSDPASITTGDFDGDRVIDIVTANRGDWTINYRGSVSVLLGNGDGTFKQKVDYDTGGSGSYSVATGDFNGDGWTDLVAANFWSRSISILLNVYGLPTGSITINNGADTTCAKVVDLILSATDDSGVVSQMRFSNDGVNWSEWGAYSTSKNWTLSSGYGTKTVYVQYKDGGGNISSRYSDTIYLYPITPGEVAAVVTDMLAWGVITNNGYANALTSTLNNAQANMEIDPISARNMLEATKNKLEAQSDKKISQDAAERLIVYLNCAISNL